MAVSGLAMARGDAHAMSRWSLGQIMVILMSWGCFASSSHMCTAAKPPPTITTLFVSPLYTRLLLLRDRHPARQPIPCSDGDTAANTSSTTTPGRRRFAIDVPRVPWRESSARLRTGSRDISTTETVV